MKQIQEKERGFLTVDLGTAVLVLMIFVTIMTSMMYSLNLSSAEARKTANALNYAVDIFEYIGKVPYSSVTAKSVLSELTFITKTDAGNNDQEAIGTIGTGNRSLYHRA